MSCIHSHPPFYTLHPQLTGKQQLRTAKLLWLSSNEPTSLVLHSQTRPPSVPLRTKAIPTSLVLGATSPAKSGDIMVFLQTSAVLLFAYGIANFLVPNLIFKYFQFDKASEAQKPSDDSSLEDKKASSQANSQTKKRGFNSTKT